MTSLRLLAAASILLLLAVPAFPDDGAKATAAPAIEAARLKSHVEWLAAPSLEARSIQFHPEASPGPHDARNILSDFVNRSAHSACRPALISAAS